MFICASTSSSLTSFWIWPVTPPGQGRTSFSCIVRPTKNVSQILARSQQKPEDGLLTNTWDFACTHSGLEAQASLGRPLPGRAPSASAHSSRAVLTQSCCSKAFFLLFKPKQSQGKPVASVRGCLTWHFTKPGRHRRKRVCVCLTAHMGKHYVARACPLALLLGWDLRTQDRLSSPPPASA